MTTPIVPSIADEQLAELERVTNMALGGSPESVSRNHTLMVTGALIARLRAAEKELTEITYAIPCSTYMDPPDGGGVSIPEQVRRMAKDAKRYLWLRERAGVLPEDCKTIWVLMDGCRMNDIERQETDQAIDNAMEQQL